MLFRSHVMVITFVCGENPNSATYEGDDHYMVQFVLSDGQVDVTVLTQDSQSESSPINGLYELKK